MSSYEFSEQQNKTMVSLATRLTAFGILIIINGLLRVVVTFARQQAEGGTLAVLVVLVIALFNIAIGVMIWHPADNFKRIATTQGKDIHELMTGLKELTSGFNLMQYLVGVAIILVLVELILRLR